jgi:hypothetical protein
MLRGRKWGIYRDCINAVDSMQNPRLSNTIQVRMTMVLQKKRKQMQKKQSAV